MSFICYWAFQIPLTSPILDPQLSNISIEVAELHLGGKQGPRGLKEQPAETGTAVFVLLSSLFQSSPLPEEPPGGNSDFSAINWLILLLWKSPRWIHHV